MFFGVCSLHQYCRLGPATRFLPATSIASPFVLGLCASRKPWERSDDFQVPGISRDEGGTFTQLTCKDFPQFWMKIVPHVGLLLELGAPNPMIEYDWIIICLIVWWPMRAINLANYPFYFYIWFCLKEWLPHSIHWFIIIPAYDRVRGTSWYIQFEDTATWKLSKMGDPQSSPLVSIQWSSLTTGWFWDILGYFYELITIFNSYVWHNQRVYTHDKTDTSIASIFGTREWSAFGLGSPPRQAFQDGRWIFRGRLKLWAPSTTLC